MPNPLTLISAPPRNGAKSEAVQGTDGEPAGGFAFEDALNEQSERPDSDQEPLTVSEIPATVVHAPHESDETTPPPQLQNIDTDGVEYTQTGLQALSEQRADTSPLQRWSTPKAGDPGTGTRTIPAVSFGHATITSTAPPADAGLPDPTTRAPQSAQTNQVTPGEVELNVVGEQMEPRKGTVSVMEAVARNLHQTPSPEAQGFAASALPKPQPAQTSSPRPISTPTSLVPSASNNAEEAPDLRAEANIQDLPALREATSTHIPRDGISATSPASARPEVARAIAGQMAAVISAKSGAGGVEIALNPEELGRVSITLNGRDDGLHLTIVAERPETMDLMRRHIAILSSEFEKLGYGGLSLDLGASHDPPPESDQPKSDADFDREDAATAVETTARPMSVSTNRGLDMRL